MAPPPTRARQPAPESPRPARPRGDRPERIATRTPRRPMPVIEEAPPRRARDADAPERWTRSAMARVKPPRIPPAEAASPVKQAAAAGPRAAAPPAPRRARKAKASPDRLQQLVAASLASLEADKAEEIRVLDVTDRASFTDRMIIATGQVERQIQAMATHLEEALEKVGLKLRRDAIQASPDWVLIDCGDLVIHLFRPEAREVYALERMWGPESPLGAEPLATPPDEG